jgi:hypothetical protein
MPEGLRKPGWRLESVTQDAIPSVDLGAEGRGPSWYRVLPAWLRHWAPPATMAAVGISLIIHASMWVVAAAIMIGGSVSGAAGGAGDAGPIGVAVMTEAELGELTGGAALDPDAPAVPETPSDALPGGETDLHVADVVAAGGIEPGGLGEGLGDLTSGLGAGDAGAGSGLGTGGAGGGAASFFGVEARGTRFAYIIDISGSMETGIGIGEMKRMDVLKTELRKSVQALLENAQFFVATFSDDAKPLGGRIGWTQGTEAGKTTAQRLISNIVSEGATMPLSAFEMVFRNLRPRPDAIYFMTDGEFDPDVALRVARLNAEFRIPIHTISFISDAGKDVMQKIASESGGTYTHVPGPRK